MSERISLTDYRKLRDSGVPSSLDKKSSSKRKGYRPSNTDKLTQDVNTGSAKRSGKYNAKKTLVKGIEFDSKVEAERYLFLLEQERKNTICDLILQESFQIIVNDDVVCTYMADFSYKLVSNGSKVVEDVKGVKTPIYRLKKKLLKASLGIDILEVTKENISSL
jgi:hypothetical protein